MSDFGLACVYRSSQYKVGHVSGTVGFACLKYIRTGVNGPVGTTGKPNEFRYLVDHLQGSLQKVVEMLELTRAIPAVYVPSGHSSATRWKISGACSARSCRRTLLHNPWRWSFPRRQSGVVPGVKLLRRSGEETRSGIQGVCYDCLGIQCMGPSMTMLSSRTPPFAT